EVGFAKPLTWELVWLMISHATRPGLTDQFVPSVLACMAAHVVGLGLLWSSKISASQKTVFFAAQLLLFASGILGVLLWIHGLIMQAPPDGECIDEDPYRASAFAGWVVASSIIALLSWCAGPAESLTLDHALPTLS
ncbi:MAG: hypothetical protein JWO08_4300, partial [Verrucomicrobiaceae bacterium]|nr:hypothetical protein [Verrucomicrobiaceae bacterium]